MHDIYWKDSPFERKKLNDIYLLCQNGEEPHSVLIEAKATIQDKDARKAMNPLATGYLYSLTKNIPVAAAFLVAYATNEVRKIPLKSLDDLMFKNMCPLYSALTGD